MTNYPSTCFSHPQGWATRKIWAPSTCLLQNTPLNLWKIDTICPLHLPLKYKGAKTINIAQGVWIMLKVVIMNLFYITRGAQYNLDYHFVFGVGSIILFPKF
jgi:hypothetical protein